MQKKPFTVADYLLTRLKQLNVTEVFQIPGDYVKYFTTALEAFPGVRAIGCMNELDAGYAADAYGRTRGLGAVSLQYGVSTFSALNAIAGAYVERSPVVVISAIPSTVDHQVTKMYDVLFHHSTGNFLADQEVYRHVTVDAITLSTSVGAARKIDELIIAALTFQRPVYIACYEEVWGEACPEPSTHVLKPLIIKSDPLTLANAVAAAWTQITAAKNPLIFAGVEILRHGLSGLLQELIDASGFLYTTTSLGKTVLDENSSRFIGTYSDAASNSNVMDTVTNADCILTLGTIITDDYNVFVSTKYANMVLATTEQVRSSYFIFENVTMKDFMEGLLHQFKKTKGYPVVPMVPLLPAYPEPWVSNSDPYYNDKPDILTYNRFFQHSIKFLADNNMFKDIVMTYGVSSAMYVATNANGLAQGSFIASAAWQCIGFETGAASGAQMGSGKRAWTVAGDGGFMMICQSLSTLARNKLNAVIFVISNAVYAIEQVYVNMNSFNNPPQPEVPFDAFDILPQWDYLALAQAFGAIGRRVTTVAELSAVLAEIKNIEGKPTLVEVVIPKRDLPGQMQRLGNEPSINL